MPRRKYDITQTPEYAEYQRARIKADRRLTRIENLSNIGNYDKIKEYAYKTAKHDVKALGGGTSFKSVPIMSKRDLQRAQKAVNSFLGSKTSTKSGIDAVYKGRATRFNKAIKDKYGFNPKLTWEDYKSVFDFMEGQKDKSFDYKDNGVAYGLKENLKPAELKKIISDAKKIVKYIPGSSVDAEIIVDLVEVML